MSHWEEKYRARTIPWDRGATSPALLGWLQDGELQSGRVLIPGCGHGHEALELARRGFAVTALDIAPTALEHLAAELNAAGVDAERVCADALIWRPEQPFDAIYSRPAYARSTRSIGPRMNNSCSPGYDRAAACSRCSCRPTSPAARPIIAPCRKCARCSRPAAGNGRTAHPDRSDTPMSVCTSLPRC